LAINKPENKNNFNSTKMKIIIPVLFLAAISQFICAQEFDKEIASAKTAYTAGNYDDSRFAVQNALNAIDIQIGRQVLALLPAKINDMSSTAANDQVSSQGTAYVGMFVQRIWEKTGSGKVTFSIISDSPLMGSINTLLMLPFISSDSNQKKIKVEGYKAILEKKVGENAATTGYNIMLPLNNTLLQVNYEGSISEQDFLTILQQIPVSKVASTI